MALMKQCEQMWTVWIGWTSWFNSPPWHRLELCSHAAWPRLLPARKRTDAIRTSNHEANRTVQKKGNDASCVETERRTWNNYLRLWLQVDMPFRLVNLRLPCSLPYVSRASVIIPEIPLGAILEEARFHILQTWVPCAQVIQGSAGCNDWSGEEAEGGGPVSETMDPMEDALFLSRVRFRNSMGLVSTSTLCSKILGSDQLKTRVCVAGRVRIQSLDTVVSVLPHCTSSSFR